MQIFTLADFILFLLPIFLYKRWKYHSWYEKIAPWFIEIHPKPFKISDELCCDLLSKLHLSSLKYINLPQQKLKDLVVICFQNCILVHWNTSKDGSGSTTAGCDLLSKLYLSSLKYIRKLSIKIVGQVVICFQITIRIIPLWKHQLRHFGVAFSIIYQKTIVMRLICYNKYLLSLYLQVHSITFLSNLTKL